MRGMTMALVVALTAATVFGGEQERFHALRLDGYMDGSVATGKKATPVAYESGWRFIPDEAKVDDGRIVVDGAPFEITTDEDGAWKAVDAGLSTWRSMTSDERGAFHPKWCRASAENGDLVLHAPKETIWYRACVLAASVDAGEREPVLSFRCGGFQNRGFISDVTVPVPGMTVESATGLPGVFVGPDGRKRKGMLHRLTVLLPAGSLLKFFEGVCRGWAHFDMQLTGRLHVKVSAPDPFNFSVMPLGRPSAAQVWGVTLERAPLALSVDGTSRWNIFADGTRPTMTLVVTNRSATRRTARLTATWRSTARDVDLDAKTESWTITLAPGAEKRIAHEPDTPAFGVWDYDVVLADEEGAPLLEHATTFARLPAFEKAWWKKDRLRSRFCVWWWNGAHGTLGKNAGLHAADNLGLGYVHIFAKDKQTWDVVHERGMEGYFDDAVLCFHETNISGAHMMRYPPLMLDEEPYELNEQEEAKFQSLWKKGVAKCEKARKEKPDTLIIFGNSSFATIEEFLRRKFPARYIDRLGHEACGLMRMAERQPELASLQEVFWFRRAAEEYGYDAPVTGCSEWLYHGTNPGNHSMQTQADLYVRDILHGLAYGFDRICPATLEDVGGGYYWSNWGAAGLVTRAPDTHPKPSYAAYAVAAHLLADAETTRVLPTGSHSVFCFETTRRRGDRILAAWTLRGERDIVLTVADGDAPVRIGQQGNRSELPVEDGRISLTLSPSPAFIEGVSRCESAVAAPPAFPEPDLPEHVVIAPLETLDGWELVTEEREELDNGNFDMPRQRGVFDVRAVTDGDRGPCLQFTLEKTTRYPGHVPAYQEIRREKPLPLEGRPTALGLHVRGNSGWGRIDLELRDAKGERWLSVGMPGAWNANDEQSVSWILHDGWRWMRIPLPGHFGGGFHWPRYAIWRHDDGDGVVDYPLRLTAVIVEQRTRVVYGTEMVDADTTPVRIRNLTALYGDPEVVDDWQNPNRPFRRDGYTAR